MGGSSSKRRSIWHKKKKSPLDKAWSKLQGALPNKKRQKKSKVNLDNIMDKMKRERKNSHNRFSPTDKKRLSLAILKKTQTSPLGRKRRAGGGRLGSIGENIKRRFSLLM